MKQQIYVNLPVKDLKKSISFFKDLGFEFNLEFTDDSAACLVIGENIFVMLLTEAFFKKFLPTQNTPCDSRKNTEVLVCINVENRKKVDEMVQKATSLGANIFREPQEHGFMYGQSFQDLDGHVWEIMWMDQKDSKDIVT